MDFLMLIGAAPGTPLIVAGGMGGIARWLYVILLDKKMAVGQGIATVILGAILGYYASPYFVGAADGVLEFGHFSTDPAKLPSFTAFTVGVAGIGLVGLLIDWVGEWRKKLIPEASVVLNPKPTGDGP